MGRDLALALLVVLAVADGAGAAARKDEDTRRRATRADAARLMKEAVRTGTADADAFAAIVDWILYEKEEKVAAGLADLLAEAAPALSAKGDARWDDTTRAMIGLFTSALRDAEGNRRRGMDDGDVDLSALVSAAAPAIAAALREVDPAAKARFLAAFSALGPAADDLVPLLSSALSHPQREVRVGAATALAALGRSAGAALPALRAAASDEDAEVRAAAAEALRKVGGRD